MAEQITLAVIGGGIAGLVAAREAAASGATVWHIMGQDVMGGLVANVGVLENFSGGEVAGIDLATTLFTDASEMGVEPVLEDVQDLAVVDNGLALLLGETKLVVDRVIVATGARLRRLAVPGASEFEDLGLSYCGWCDGPLHRGKPVVVVGGGDSALQEALHLATIASTVTLLVRGDVCKARPEYVARVRDEPNIDLRLGTEVVAVLGEVNVTGVHMRKRATGAEATVACSGLFPFIGLEPATHMLPPSLARTAAGALITNAHLETSIPGIFAAGAVRSGYSGQLDDAIDEARRAVDSALNIAASR
ncbi:MAG: NAD(P)/FAD-dependent oxidoreductase [Hyphomicrobiaceae bacterium]